MMDVDDFCTILKSLRKQKKITQDELASMLDVGKTTVSNYETGYSSPDKDTIIKMAGVFNVSIDYLLGRISAKEGDSLASGLMMHKNTLMVQLPVFGLIRSTDPLKDNENIIDYIDLPRDYLGTGEYFGYRVHGDSMNLSKLEDGDYCLIRKQDYVDNGDLALVLVGGEAYIRIFYRQGKNVTLLPNSSNRTYEPKFCDATYSVSIIGKPVKAIISM